MTTLQEAAQRAHKASGHYFKFERGEYVQAPGEPAKFYPASGLDYCGGLTLDQRRELDSMIRAYLDKAAKPKHSPLPEVAPPVEQPGAVGLSEQQIEMLFCDAIGIDHDHLIMGTPETYKAGQWFKRGYKVALASAQPAAPGWMLVPVEPDIAMLHAALTSSRYSGTLYGDGKQALPVCSAEQVYLAMLAAAPTFAATQGAKT